MILRPGNQCHCLKVSVLPPGRCLVFKDMPKNSTGPSKFIVRPASDWDANGESDPLKDITIFEPPPIPGRGTLSSGSDTSDRGLYLGQEIGRPPPASSPAPKEPHGTAWPRQNVPF